LAVTRKVMLSPINECLLCARFQHCASQLSVIVGCASTESADMADKDQFYMQLEAAVTDCKK